MHRGDREGRSITYQAFDVEEENVALRVLGIAAKALDREGSSLGADRVAVLAAVAAVELLQLVQAALRGVTDGRQVSVSQTSVEVKNRSLQLHEGS